MTHRQCITEERLFKLGHLPLSYCSYLGFTIAIIAATVSIGVLSDL